MKIVLEVTGGFTGPAGKQVIEVDPDALPAEDRAKLRGDLAHLPATVWGHSFLSPHPKPWDFLHVLRVTDGSEARAVSFHLGQGPPELSRIAELLKDLDSRSG